MTWASVKLFLKAQVSAFSGGVTDYGLMILLTEWLHIHFTISILISGTVGGMVNFCINRYWAFKTDDGYCSSTSGQLIRFFTVVLGSISLKSAGTYLLHRSLNLDYKLGRLLIDSIVSYGFNYPLMKYWVFKINKLDASDAEEEDYFETLGKEQRV
ncbi:polysaccharide biosynthesis protein GtrA [Pedobacter ginsenosidimutans]|uniref:Polysaccharide biosynthesis protein GtrA n=1 Tax=Pedobacter ginsenosidimutans TaxID=687842 RepID=A0A0T5VIW7_9SPHI|nr:GtrA family protein [Pedobacter ginsenosidimutans]KRT13820.1 polysaccharide biosynthesis protein GtrA [Pedobacter ginsenosidimutans]